ncbi:MAG: CoA transferase [Pseudomonadales bacterium]|nr:CoA transferase [Pseudomonadales bacterium]
MIQAFKGIKILDFSQVLSAPVAVMQLALLGAEVIKIEQPGVGDQMRRIMNAGPDANMSPSFLGMNVNKRSLTLNFREPAAQDIIRKLLVDADVLVENFKAGTMARYGFGYDAVRAIKPDIVYCSVSGFGQDGPLAPNAAYDGAIQASSGMMAQTGHPESGPTRNGFMTVDMATGIYAAFAIAASLHRHATTGLGQYIDVAMMDTAVLLQATQFNNYFIQDTVEDLIGNSSQTGIPTADLYATKDGFLQITAIKQSQVEKLFDVIGQSETLARPEFLTMASRKENAKLVYDFIENVLSTHAAKYWETRLADAGVPVARIRNVPDVVSDPQFDTREIFETMASPITDGEKITVVKAGFKSNEDGPTVRHAAPHVGEHTAEILSELGYSEEDIQTLRANSII